MTCSAFKFAEDASCAGPYGHSLLGVDMERPGWVQLKFNYFIDTEEFEYLLFAVELVAKHGWRLLPFYQFDNISGVWRYQGKPVQLESNIENWKFADFFSQSQEKVRHDTMKLDGVCDKAESELKKRNTVVGKSLNFISRKRLSGCDGSYCLRKWPKNCSLNRMEYYDIR